MDGCWEGMGFLEAEIPLTVFLAAHQYFEGYIDGYEKRTSHKSRFLSPYVLS